MMVPLLVSAFTFLVNLSLLLKLATRPSSPISLSPPLTCRKFQTLGRRAAGGGFDFLDSKPRLVEPNIDEVETPGPGIKTTSPNCFLLSGGF